MILRRFLTAALATASLTALAACGSATDSITFTAPDGFQSKASLGPFMQIWTGKKDEHQVLMLLALPVQTDLKKAVNQAQIKGGTMTEGKQIAICGNQVAIYAEGTGEVSAGTNDSSSTKTGKPSKVEILATEVKGKTYVAMYARPLSAPADPAAEKAIQNVCPK